MTARIQTTDVAQFAASLGSMVTRIEALERMSGRVGTPPPPGVTDHGLLTGLADNDHPQYVLDAGDTMTGPLVLTGAASQLTIGVVAGPPNWITFPNSSGVAPPTVSPTAVSIGTKIILYPGRAIAGQGDYAIGIDAGTLWLHVPSTAEAFKWYGGTTVAAQLTGAGALALLAGLTCTSISCSSIVGTGTITMSLTTGVSTIHTATIGSWDGNASYFAIRHSGAGTGSYSMLGTVNTTYISTPDANGVVYIRPGANTTTYQWQFAPTGAHVATGTQFTFRPVAADNGFKINGGSIFCYQAATALSDMYSQNTNEGMTYRAGAILSVAVSTNSPFIANRITSDGNVIQIQSLGVTQGLISVAGTTTTYGAFCGAHWGQLIDNAHPDLLRGTVMESIDEMCEWPEEANDQLAKVKVSDTPGSKRVYGVFMTWDDPKGEAEPSNDTNDMNVAALGAWLIRVAAGVTVQGGDLLESNGDGCARPQADDLFRASTIAKVTSISVVETYDDGSYLVPCTLHCG